MCSLEHTQVHLPSITCPSPLTRAILRKLHLVVIPPIGTSQLLHHLSRLLRPVAMITTVNSRLHSNSKHLVVLQRLLIILVTITVSHLLQAIIKRGKVTPKMATVGIMHHLNLGMVSHRHMISSKVILLHLAMGMWPTQHKMATLLPMGLRGIQLKLLLSSLHLWASKDTLVLNSLAQVLQVIHLREQLRLVMECLQLLKPAMEINHKLSLDMGLAMDHPKVRNLLLIRQFMGRLPSLPAHLEATASQPLGSQDIPLLNHHPLVMLNQNLVHNVPHHPITVLQVLSLVMDLHLMVLHLSVSQVMGRHHHHTMPMPVLIHSLLFILRMPVLVAMLVVLMMQHLLLRLLSRVELPKHHPKVDDYLVSWFILML